MKKLMLLSVLAVFGSAFGITTNEWTGAVNDWDWTDAGNFTGGKPASGDLVLIPTNASVRLLASTDAGSLAVVNALSRLLPLSTNSLLTVTVATGDEKDLTVPFCPAGGYSNGELALEGGGTLNLTAKGIKTGSNYSDYYTHLHVKAGSLKMPKEISGSDILLGKVTVDAGAYFYPYSAASAKAPSSSGNCALYWAELWGDGTVTNDTPTAKSVYYLRPNGYTPCWFGGVISKQFRLFTAGGYWNLTGENTVLANEISTVYRNFGKGPDGDSGILGMKKFGQGAAAASAGGHTYLINIRGDGACIRYLGDGETSDRHITWQSSGSSSYWNFIDGGPVGGLNLSGNIQAYQNGAKTMAPIYERFMLTGSNTTACAITGQVLTQTASNSDAIAQPFFGKQGSGTWRFADTADNATYRNFGTPFVIEGGTFAFDSIAEAGSACSLGYGNKLYEPFSGAEATKAVAVDWFFALGRTNANHAIPTLAYSGLGRVEGAALCSTRPIELRGSGRLANESGHAMKFAGVSAKAGGDEAVKYLYLGGTNDCGDTVLDIVDGTNAKTGIVKDGSGSWTLHGNLTFTGPIDVREGTLKVRNSSRYTWFKFMVAETLSSCSRYKGSSASLTAFTSIQLGEIGIFDAAGTRLTAGLGTMTAIVSNYFNLAEGQVAVDTLDYTGYNWTGGDGYFTRNLDKLFDGTLGGAGCSFFQQRVTGKSIQLGVPETWNGYVFRLPASVTTKAVKYDVGEIGGYTYGDSNRLVTACSLYASADGVRWDLVDDKRELELAKSGSHWCSDKSSGANPTGFAIRGERDEPFTVGTFSAQVADGASLVREGEGDVTLNALTLATGGNGTIDGFTFAETGVLTISGSLEPTGDVRLPVFFENTVDLANVAGWTVQAGGRTLKATLSVTPTGITVHRQPLTIIFE